MLNDVLIIYTHISSGFLQLAGGTNAHTIDGLKKVGLFQTATISGTIKLTVSLRFMPNGFLVRVTQYVVSKNRFFYPAEGSKGETLPADSCGSCSSRALIGGVAFGGYARKVCSPQA